MSNVKFLSLLAGFLLVAGVVSAGCASDAYAKACSSCSFDKDGKIDQSCSKGFQDSGTACVSTTYPIMAAKYAQGKCPDVDTCAQDLQACTAQFGSGDDKADCAEGSVGSCYATADSCVKSAAIKCGEMEKQCPGSTATFVLIFGGIAFIRIRK